MGGRISAAMEGNGARIVLAALTAFLAFAGLIRTARAEDRPGVDEKPAPNLLTQPVPSWAGMYAGLNAGAAIPLYRGEHFHPIFTRQPPALDLYPPSGRRSGVTVGAQVGYNWQIGRLVYGVETDFNLLDGQSPRNGSFFVPKLDAPREIFGYALSYDPGSSFFASLRGRIGLSLDQTLVYLTGGVALGGTRGAAKLDQYDQRVRREYRANPSGARDFKYIVGAGAEHPLSADTSVRLEYFFLNQGLNGQFFPGPDETLYWSKTRDENHIVRMGLNHHFGVENRVPGAPIEKNEDGEDVTEEIYSVHGVSTTAVQGFSPFRADYSGRQSFSPSGQVRSGTISDIFMGIRLWEGASAFVNPELNQGYGPQNTLGAANYVNGSTTRVGTGAPYLRIQRYFLRQIVGLGGGGETDTQDASAASEQLESTLAQVAGKVDRDRVTFTVGKMSVQDIFDDNQYAHDPTRDFLNFAFITLGAFDYAANAWGYTDGAAVEWRQNWWTARGGVYQLAEKPGAIKIEPVLLRQFMAVGELEGRYEIAGQPGVAKLLLFSNNGNFSKFDDVINGAFLSSSFPPSVSNFQRRGQKNGFGVNLAQQIAPGIGVFARGGLNDGRYQTIDYTDVNQSISAGVVFDGDLWDRSADRIGVAAAASGISGAYARYLRLGGLGSFIGDGGVGAGNSLKYYLPGRDGSPTGDGRLSYGSETVFESFYRCGMTDWLEATIDHQLIINPGYNTARGPVNFFGLRLRAEF
jgi:high affinity Mn2+ porin